MVAAERSQLGIRRKATIRPCKEEAIDTPPRDRFVKSRRSAAGARIRNLANAVATRRGPKELRKGRKVCPRPSLWKEVLHDQNGRTRAGSLPFDHRRSRTMKQLIA
jgi:hypothetical protein